MNTKAIRATLAGTPEVGLGLRWCVLRRRGVDYGAMEVVEEEGGD